MTEERAPKKPRPAAPRKVGRRAKKKVAKHGPPTKLARAIRMERDRKGWSSLELSEATKRLDPDGKGVSHSWVRNYEIGIIQNASAKFIRLLEQAMGLRTGELYAASIPIPYEKLVEELLSDQDQRKAPWEQLLALQEKVLAAVESLNRRLSPSASALDSGVPESLVDDIAGQVVERIDEREHRPAEADGVS